MTLARRLLTVLASLLILSPAFSQEPGTEPPQVLPIGTFHFKDAGLDVAKVEDFNVMAEEPQAYLVQLTRRLAEFQPTAVLLEFNPANDEEMNLRYTDYLAGQFELPANEIYQLGFRIARLAGLDRVHSWDHREVPWQYSALSAYAEQHGSPEFQQSQEGLATYMAEETEARASSTLGQLLRRHNDPANERLNMDLYLMTNVVGVGDSWVGADSTASWWHRNFRMYANIQQHAKPGARVIVIGGSGHMAIIKKLLDIDTRIQGLEPLDYF